MKTYEVLTRIRHERRTYVEGEEVAMTAAQAKYPLMNGQIADPSAKPAKSAKSEKATS